MKPAAWLWTGPNGQVEIDQQSPEQAHAIVRALWTAEPLYHASFTVNARVFHTCEQAIEAAVAQERERCARTIEEWAAAAQTTRVGFASLQHLAQAIRAGEPQA